MKELKIQTAWELYDYIEGLYPDELTKIKPKKVVFVEDLVTQLQNKILRASQEIENFENLLQTETNDYEKTVLKAKIATLDVGINSYRTVLNLLGANKDV